MTQIHLLLVVFLGLSSASAVFAQDVDDAVLKLSEPDFTRLVGLPTALPAIGRTSTTQASRSRSAPAATHFS